MKKIILACAMLLGTTTAVAGRDVGDSHAPLDNAVLDPRPDRPDLTCNTGGPTSMLVGVVVLGLLARRRR